MRVALIYNPKAGAERTTGEELGDLIRAGGHDVARHSSKDDHLAALLDERPELVAVAGGDGTVSKVVTIVMGRDIPLAVLPTGTANNIARTLGVARIALARQIAAWPHWRRTPLNVGLARGPWGSRHFVESTGMGLLAWSIPQADSSAMLHHMDGAQRKLAYVRKMLADRLERAPLLRCKASLDGKDVSGDYVLLEAMNIRSIGSRLALAPDADPGDGLLDLVAVSSTNAKKLRKHLAASGNRSGHLADLPRRSGKRVTSRKQAIAIGLSEARRAGGKVPKRKRT
ncbi:MAG TPA: diacylglycerol kinase family protein [Casimicrobiaceae bacterium]|nr:diacylglycerol kinase family protein [Casimicrobiaceae bacterium]